MRPILQVDALAPHVREAKQAVYLGTNPRDYTNKEKLLQVAEDWGVDAIHPGYGFLSENEEFCKAVEAAGIIWLGPTAKTLHDFALKHVARKIAEEAGVGGWGTNVAGIAASTSIHCCLP